MSRADDTYLGQLQVRYRRAGRKEKSAIRNEFAKTTNHHRKHAVAILNGCQG